MTVENSRVIIEVTNVFPFISMHALYHEYRCPDCDKLLFKGLLVDSEIEINCKRCKGLKVVKGEPHDRYICLKENCVNRISVANS